MSVITVFDPPMCCATGVCGPVVDPDLVAFAALLEELRRDGVETLRHGLATDPGAFVENPEVLDRITREGNQCLPLVYVGDRLLASGKYPSRESLRAALEEPR